MHEELVIKQICMNGTQISQHVYYLQCSSWTTSYIKCFKIARDNFAASTITLKNEVGMDEKEEIAKDEISFETA